MQSDFPRAFLFDCDGTLFDTERLKAKSWGRAMGRLLRSQGIDYPLEMEDQVILMYQAGGTTEEVAGGILDQCKKIFSKVTSWPSAKELIATRDATKKELFDEAFPQLGAKTESAFNLVIEPVWKLAVQVKRDGYPIALVTTTERNWVQRYFGASSVKGVRDEPIRSPELFFDVVVCGKKKGVGIQEAICHISGIDEFSQVPWKELGNYIIVEDSPEGIREAKSVGVRVVAVPNDFTKAAFPDLLVSQQNMANMSVVDVVQSLA